MIRLHAMGAPHTLTVPATPSGVSQAADALDAFGRRECLPDRVRTGLLTCLDEILCNVVSHGLDGGRARTDIQIQFACEDNRVVVEVDDDAPAFDPLQTPPPDTTSPLEQRRVGGLGIAFVKALTDEVRYERRGERNHLTLTWRF
jgi:anti-sigma regulatory factor (Ser/Thr protein kinase)